MTSPPATREVPSRLAERLEALDVSLLETIESKTRISDKRSLLALHLACSDVYSRFTYLEIGSHLGGSLQALASDPRCTAIVSIDSRPPTVPNYLLGTRFYPGNSTARMLELLGGLPEADVSKIETVDASTEEIYPESIRTAPQLLFIDGEHTHAVTLRDARFCRAVCEGPGAIAFHDRPTILGAIAEFVSELFRDGIDFAAYPLPDNVFVVELGGSELHLSPAIDRAVAAGRLSPAGRWLVRNAGRRDVLRGAVLRLHLSQVVGIRHALFVGRYRMRKTRTYKQLRKRVRFLWRKRISGARTQLRRWARRSRRRVKRLFATVRKWIRRATRGLRRIPGRLGRRSG